MKENRELWQTECRQNIAKKAFSPAFSIDFRFKVLGISRNFLRTAIKLGITLIFLAFLLCEGHSQRNRESLQGCKEKEIPGKKI